MKKYLIVILSCTIWVSSFSQRLIESSVEELIKISVNQKPQASFGYTDALPKAVSLEKYCPIPLKQKGQSCVGFGIAYGAMSIRYNYLHDFTAGNMKFVNTFDPYFVYSSIKADDLECIGTDCDCGALLWEGMDVLVNYGCKKMMVSPSLECNSTLTKSNLRALVSKTTNYAIDEYWSLINYSESNNSQGYDKEILWDYIKKGIASGLPIVCGIEVKSDFGTVSLNGNYQPQISGAIDGSHCVTIVGYDDLRSGGSFRLMNSYGTEWGDEGFFWLSYDDFEKYASEAYVMTKEDWSSWLDSYTKENYYKSYDETTTEYFEGTIEEEGFYHGASTIYMNSFGVGTGAYKKGYKNGWWLIMAHGDSNDADYFAGWMLFDNGKVIDSEAFGFSSEEVVSIESLSEAYHLDMIDVTLDKTPGTADTFDPEELKKQEERGKKQ
jgi:hypothetical protein